MNAELAEAIDNNCGGDIDGFDLRPDYSGRCMFGKTTHALVMDDRSDLMPAVIRAMDNIEDDTGMDSDEIAHKLEGLRSDSMGLGIVLY